MFKIIERLLNEYQEKDILRFCRGLDDRGREELFHLILYVERYRCSL